MERARVAVGWSNGNDLLAIMFSFLKNRFALVGWGATHFALYC
jgi:hypothetical protein